MDIISSTLWYDIQKGDDASTTQLTCMQEILLQVNVQHACFESGCGATGHVPQVQERRETSVTRQAIVHTNDTHFIINMHALHNAKLLRQVLPRSMTEPQPYVPDRRAHHCNSAARLRATNTEKRAEKQAQKDAVKEAAVGGSGAPVCSFHWPSRKLSH